MHPRPEQVTGHGPGTGGSPAAGQEPAYRIRARHSPETITVYQAYPPAIGLPAARDGRFPVAWKRDRMTWIKPSFLWMMYRCGWATKEGQETVLAVEITREGFAWALRNACLSHYVAHLHTDHAAWRQELKRSPARVQWDPERDLRLNPLPYRSLQLGLSGPAARRYADEWMVAVTDVTPLAREVHAKVRAGDLTGAAELLPRETPYPVEDGLLAHLRA
ncbi:DUF4291 domain-containing protein [Streptomyces pactum]|uniref:DUF4291 domain-containing protein n=1 Tax=Streptomyces pactum TaxID=68249 RepID=A0ABS0NK58_9ACTN|nr:DUF4291 domain-containing protein [Streptomyces pactum]